MSLGATLALLKKEKAEKEALEKLSLNKYEKDTGGLKDDIIYHDMSSS